MTGVPGGKGWIIRDTDLRPEITDLQAFQQAHESDPLADTLELLWTGHADEAIVALDNAAETLGPTVRIRALRADCLRDLGYPKEAVAIYEELFAEAQGTSREPFIRQHRGKALIAAGRTDEAHAEFARVVEMRTGGDSALLASAVQALNFAQRAMRSRR